MEGSVYFVIDYIFMVYSNWQKMSASHPLLIQGLIDPPHFVVNETKKHANNDTKNVVTKYKIAFMSIAQ